MKYCPKMASDFTCRNTEGHDTKVHTYSFLVFTVCARRRPHCFVPDRRGLAQTGEGSRVPLAMVLP